MADLAPEASNKQLYEIFYASFLTTRANLESRLESLKASKTDAQVQDLTQDIAKLRKDLVENTALLPSYDKRQCELQMAQLEASLSGLRASDAVKPKFAFKRKAGAPKSSPPPAPSGQSEAKHSALTTFRTLSGRSSARLGWMDVPPSASGQHDLTVADLDHCVLDLLSRDGSEETLTAMHIRGVRDSVLLLPLVAGSVLLHDLERCILVVGCHQYRMHTSKDVRVLLYVSSNPIIEHCSSISFGAYPASLLNLSSEAEQLSPSKNTEVQDFSHIRATPSPNWRALNESEMLQWNSVQATLNEGDVDIALDTLLK